MKIAVINPNTTASMTRTIADAARAAAAPGTTIIAVTSTTGPVSIECHYDEALSVVGILEQVRAAERAGVDGFVIACFGDPGLMAARECATGPVIGIAEAAMHLASLVATRFAIVTTLERTCVIASHLVERYGMTHQCASIRGTALAVLDLEPMQDAAYDAIAHECRRALAEERAEAIVLGCAGMADLCRRLSRQFGVPVIDGVAAAVKLVESLVSLGLSTSKVGDLAPPPGKAYVGILQGFTCDSDAGTPAAAGS